MCLCRLFSDHLRKHLLFVTDKNETMKFIRFARLARRPHQEMRFWTRLAVYIPCAQEQGCRESKQTPSTKHQSLKRGNLMRILTSLAYITKVPVSRGCRHYPSEIFFGGVVRQNFRIFGGGYYPSASFFSRGYRSK